MIDPIRNERGELIGFAKVTRDITERIQTQRMLQETREARRLSENGGDRAAERRHRARF